MKKRKYKTRLISDFFGGGKSEKSSSSSFPHQTEPQSGVIYEIYTTQEEQVVPSEDTPQNETRANGSNVPINEEFVYDADLLPCDPGKRIPISYPPNDQDMIRRGFISKGVFQPRNHSFPQTEFGTRLKPYKRHFKEAWYEKYNWLEYNIEKDAAFCFVCYLFKDKTSIPRTDKFVTDGFKVHQGLACRGHNESETSTNKGNFRELLQWLAEKDENVNKVVLKNAPRKSKLICREIQIDLIHACAKETTKLILDELGDDYFAILADESSDVSYKEQLAICIRFVDKTGRVAESFLGVVKMKDTCSLSLRVAIKKMIEDNKLSMPRIRGQGYDGASNMRGESNGLKTLIMNDTPSAYYVHCFAHQLQLTLVAVAKENVDCTWFFEQVGFLLNLMGVSCKRNEMLRDIQAKKILESLELNEKKSGQGLNQELGLPRPGDTRWGSYYRTILNMMSLYPSIFDVLLIVGKTGHRDDGLKAQTMMASFESFQFVFMARLMIVIFGYTNELCQAFQRRDQDIVNAMTFVRLTKDRLLKTREEGWEHFLEGVTSFCAKNNVEVPQMDDSYVPPGRSRRYFEKVTNIHRFRYDIFVSIIDKQLQELNDRFDKVNIELLICMSSFNPINSFAAFDKKKLLKLAEFYPDNFSSTDRKRLGFQLDHFIDDMRSDARFESLQDIGQLSITLVSTNKHSYYQLVYLLLRLVLILPVATASVERVFSATTYVKNKLRNSMGDQLLNDSLVTFIERDFFSRVDNDDIIDRFQGKKTRSGLLPPRPLE
ncbi:uncharacterized protein LOC141595204 [Silene latifolia]|uniref:uncharacterized protein LOC141595204 n=1 Tax=Silene latifolia TaxID=37657 RepID=UPI003D776B11